jgi:hypothetical protein
MWGSIPACMLSMSCIDGLRKQLLLLLQQFFLSFPMLENSTTCLLKFHGSFQ